MFVILQSSYVEILMTSLMVLEGGTFERCLGHEDRAFTFGISARWRGG